MEGYSCAGGSKFSASCGIYDTCRDRLYANNFPSELKIEGCVCEEGSLMMENNACGKISKCMCYDEYASSSEHRLKEAHSISQRGCTNW